MSAGTSRAEAEERPLLEELRSTEIPLSRPAVIPESTFFDRRTAITILRITAGI